MSWRYSEQAFRRFEPYIKAIVESPDSTITLNTDGLSTETFSARLRDCLKSCQHNNWEASFDLDQLRRYKFVVKQVNDKVVVEKELKGNVGLVVENASQQVLCALALLHQEGVLKTPTKCIGVDDATKEGIQAMFDIVWIGDEML